MAKTQYDIAIIGGGLIGTSLALALASTPTKIALINRQQSDSRQHQSFDQRAIALSHFSVRRLQQLGIWESVAAEATPIKAIHVSDRGHFGTTRISAATERVEALGYVAAAAALGRALQQLPPLSVERIAPVEAEELEFEGESNRIHLTPLTGEPFTIQARLVVIADGGGSYFSDRLGLTKIAYTYHQQALTTTVTTHLPHQFCAYERFTNEGPIALLPYGNRADSCDWSLVWTQPDSQQPPRINLDDNDFLQQLQQRFGRRAGHFTAVGQRDSYPLTLRYLPQAVAPRTLFIGNASHTIHPIAGQGFNLGLRDVDTLTALLKPQLQQGSDPGDPALLHHYQSLRRSDHWRVIGTTHLLSKLFGHQGAACGALRSKGLAILDNLPSLRRPFTHQMMGYHYERL